MAAQEDAMNATLTMTETIVRTPSGMLRGTVEDGVHVFKGVPYAAPPFGADRLRPPRPAEPWTGIRDALAFGAEPPQPRMPADRPGSGHGLGSRRCPARTA